MDDRFYTAAVTRAGGPGQRQIRWMGLLVMATSCLYSDPIPTPPVFNSPPTFSSWVPPANDVELSAELQTAAEFQIFYSDPDESDQDLLEVQWLLKVGNNPARDLGQSNLVRVSVDDLAGESEALLTVRVTDPGGLYDILFWNLTVQGS